MGKNKNKKREEEKVIGKKEKGKRKKRVRRRRREEGSQALARLPWGNTFVRWIDLPLKCLQAA